MTRILQLSLAKLRNSNGRFAKIGIPNRTVVARAFSVAIGILVFGSIWVFLRQSRLENWRQTGFRAAESGDPILALEHLGNYLTAKPDDTQAMFRYAMTRRKIIAPKKTHIVDALKKLERCVELMPQDTTVWIELAQMQSVLGRSESGLFSAKRAYKLDPTNETAIGLLANALMERGSYDEAGELLDNLSVERPVSWKLGLVRLRYALETVGSNAQFVETAEEIAANALHEPRMLLLKATANWMSGEQVVASQVLQDAIQQAPLEDIDYLRALVRFASDMRAEELGIELLRRIPELDDPFLTLWYARRCWELGRPTEILEVLARRSIPLVTEPEANLLLAVSLAATGQSSKLQRLLHSLEQQQMTEAARDWGHFIVLACGARGADARALIDASSKVLAVSPSCPIVRYMQALTFYQMGEYRIAAKLAKQASRLAPNWLVLRQLEITATLILGKPEDALTISRAVFEEFPYDINTAITLAAVSAVVLPSREEEFATRLLDWTHQSNLPSSDARRQDISLIRLLAYARLGRHAKADALRKEMNFVPEDMGYSDLIRIAAHRRFRDIGLANTPPVQELVMRNGNAADLPSDTQGWRMLLSDGTTSLATLKLALVSKEAKNAPDIQATLIDELAARSPRGATAWRLLKARWLLQDDKQERHAAEAAVLLRPLLVSVPDSPDGQLLMGAAMFRLHDHSSGMEHFLAAVQSDSRSAPNALRLSLNCRRIKKWTDARSLVNFWIELTRVEMNSRVSSGPEATSQTSQANNDQRQLIDRLLVLAEYAEQTNDAQLAIETYRQILTFDPQGHLACNNLAFLIYQLPTQWEKARQLAKRAIAAVPTNLEYRKTLQSILDFRKDENAKVTTSAVDAAN